MKVLYWTTFVLAVLILQLNIGIGIVMLAIFIVPMLVMHFIVGRSLHKLTDQKQMIIFSVCNLLLFVLVRPDGVHTINDNGLSAVMDLLGFSGGYNADYEMEFFIATIVVLLIQLVIETILVLNVLSDKNKPGTRVETEI